MNLRKAVAFCAANQSHHYANMEATAALSRFMWTTGVDALQSPEVDLCIPIIHREHRFCENDECKKLLASKNTGKLCFACSTAKTRKHLKLDKL